MNILVTGATGVLGRRLSAQLAAQSHDVRALVRTWESSHMLSPKIESVQGDLDDRESLVRATRGVDAVVHLAGITHTHTASRYYQVNTDGTRHLIDACIRNGVTRFVLASSRTASLQGGAYAHSKLLAEEALKASGLQWVIVKIGEVYGGGEHDFIATLARLTAKSPLVPVIGDGGARLAPVHIDDVVEACVHAVQSAKPLQTYLIAGPREYSLNEVIDCIERKLGKKRWRIRIPLMAVRVLASACKMVGSRVLVGDQIPRLLCAKPYDPPSAAEDLNFHPRDFEEGLNTLFPDI